MISCRTIIKIIGYKLLSFEVNYMLQDMWVFVFYHTRWNVSKPLGFFRLSLTLLGLLLLNKMFWFHKESKLLCLCLRIAVLFKYLFFLSTDYNAAPDEINHLSNWGLYPSFSPHNLLQQLPLFFKNNWRSGYVKKPHDELNDQDPEKSVACLLHLEQITYPSFTPQWGWTQIVLYFVLMLCSPPYLCCEYLL